MPENAHRIEAQVLTPEGRVFEGELFQLSTVTVLGEVGIRARHVPMLARLVPHELRLYESEEDYNASDGGRRYAAAEGWMEVFANKVVVLIGEAIEPESLDVSDLEERKADAWKRIEDLEEGSGAYEVAERDRDRAEAFLKIAGG